MAEKYYKHACELVEIMKITPQYTITHQEIGVLQEKIIRWVKKYERYGTQEKDIGRHALNNGRYYYQYEEEHLSTCTLTMHGLLHVADNIHACGPVHTTWTFFMERFFGFMKQSLKSKKMPWANLNRQILHREYLNQLSYHYNLKDELGELVRDVADHVGNNAKVYAECMVSLTYLNLFKSLH